MSLHPLSLLLSAPSLQDLSLKATQTNSAHANAWILAYHIPYLIGSAYVLDFLDALKALPFRLSAHPSPLFAH